jgi:hypothetical protein
MEDRKAAEAWRLALRRPTPPREMGREALRQDQDERQPPTSLESESIIAESKSLIAS